jgi:arylformamidase
MGKLYDISPPVTPQLKVWPGDTPASREILLDMKKGDNLTLSTLRATVHVGAHADGPNHYGADAPAIDARALDYYLGPCQVVHVDVPPAVRIMPEMVTTPIDAPRILFATGTYPDPQRFNEDFAALSPELIDELAVRGVRTIGIDTPSVDLFSSKDLPSHNAILRHDMAILEGLVLAEVPPGRYELIALPLRLVGFDASPIRAVLRAI